MRLRMSTVPSVIGSNSGASVVAVGLEVVMTGAFRRDVGSAVSVQTSVPVRNYVAEPPESASRRANAATVRAGLTPTDVGRRHCRRFAIAVVLQLQTFKSFPRARGI